MTKLLSLFAVACALSAQTFTVENVSHQRLNEKQLFEQETDVLRQISELARAGVTGDYRFDVAAEVCQYLATQEASETPTRAKVLRPGADEPCSTNVSAHTARVMWEGWDYREPAGGDGTLRTVCAEGCDYATLQEAVDASALGDLIELKPESFGDAETMTVAHLADQFDFPGYCPTYTVIRTAGHTPLGRRVRPADGERMANLIGGGGRGLYNPVIRMEATRVEVNGADPATDRLTTGEPHGYAAGDELVFLRLPKKPYAWSLESDFPHQQRYYVVAPGETSLALSVTRGGPPVDITAVPEFGSIGLRKANRPVACWFLQGLQLQVPEGKGANQNIVQLWDHSPFPETQASHNRFEDLYIHGQPGMVGPQRGMWLEGRFISVRNSLIEDITSRGSSDSSAIGLARVPGPAWVENSGLSASSINLYIGGPPLHTDGIENGSMGGIVARNNYHWKKPEWYLLEQNGPPVGQCHEGSQSRDLLANSCYVCQGAAWTPAASCANAIDYTIKNLWESKGCAGCLTENLRADLSPYGDASQLYWYVVKANPSGVANDIILRNFWSRYTAAGPLLRGTVSAGEWPDTKIGPAVVWNGLSTEVDPDLYRYERGATSNGAMSLGGNDGGFEIRNLTQVGFESTANESIFITKMSEMDPPRSMDWLSIQDSILAIDNVFASGTKANCPSLQAGLASGAPVFEGNVIINPKPQDFSPCSAVTYQEPSVSAINFDSNWKQTKYSGAGVDTVELWDGLGGQDPTAGLGSWAQQYGVSIVDVGATKARITAAGGCLLNGQAGFTLTGLEPLTEYRYLVTCGEAVIPGRLFTSDVDAPAPDPEPEPDDSVMTDSQILREILRLLRERL